MTDVFISYSRKDKAFVQVLNQALADAVAIFFVSPLIVTIFSVVFLRETVGPWRWAAVLVGLGGVRIVLRPGSATFQLASILPVIAALAYASLHMLTRFIGKTESAATMTVYIQFTFITVSLAMGLAFGDGRFADQSNPSLHFLLREWAWPECQDWLLLVLTGATTGFGGYLISQAYRVAAAAIVAPFEYLALPLSIFWGFVIFGEVPAALAFLGITLILASGLFIIWRESRKSGEVAGDEPRSRR